MEKKKCFVIMPFSKTTEIHDETYWTEFFRTIKNIMEENGFTCIRSEVGPYKLFTNIVENIEESDIVVSVLTDFNANVWYELGIRHTLKIGTLMLLQEGQNPPFDIKDFGIVFYKDSIGLERYLKEEISRYLLKLQNNTCDSPVIYSLKNRVNYDVEEKMNEMQQLIWRLIDEIPRHREIQMNNVIKQNKILWVDDYPANTESVREIFKNRNVYFDIALTTEQGLELFRRKLYDIIITDMGRGKESDAGIVFIRELKYLHCEIPIIVCTRREAIQRYGKEALSLGAYMITDKIGDTISAISDILNL